MSEKKKDQLLIPEINEKELSKVENPILNIDQLQVLLGKTPKSYQYERAAKGGGKWTYVTGTYIKKQLNILFGWDWDFEVIKFDMNLEAKQCIVLGKLTVRANGRTVIKNQFGRSDIKFKRADQTPLDLGNDLKAATTDALKKCASELGIASDIYGKEEFKQIKIIPDQDQSELPEEVIAKIREISDEFDLMEYANSREAFPYQQNKNFIEEIDKKRKEFNL